MKLRAFLSALFSSAVIVAMIASTLLLGNTWTADDKHRRTLLVGGRSEKFAVVKLMLTGSPEQRKAVAGLLEDPDPRFRRSIAHLLLNTEYRVDGLTAIKEGLSEHDLRNSSDMYRYFSDLSVLAGAGEFTEQSNVLALLRGERTVDGRSENAAEGVRPMAAEFALKYRRFFHSSDLSSALIGYVDYLQLSIIGASTPRGRHYLELQLCKILEMAVDGEVEGIDLVLRRLRSSSMSGFAENCLGRLPAKSRRVPD